MVLKESASPPGADILDMAGNVSDLTQSGQADQPTLRSWVKFIGFVPVLFMMLRSFQTGIAVNQLSIDRIGI